MVRVKRTGLAGAVSLAASFLLGMAPLAGSAAPQHHDGGERHFDGPHQGPHYEGPRYGGHYEGHFDGHPHYGVPPHWVGMHPYWAGPHAGYYVRPWGPHWAPHYWGGGYWGGAFWPHVYLGWSFPWFLATLPIGYATYWWGGVPYYYWQGVYYVWSPNYGQYVVTDPPPVSGGTPEDAAPPPAQPGQAAPDDPRGAMSLFVYPKNGQSQQQTDSDRYQCHEWAVGQTGYDPTNTANDTQAATATPANYKRAVTACLTARGYSVR
jgi:hypothetical protein